MFALGEQWPSTTLMLLLLTFLFIAGPASGAASPGATSPGATTPGTTIPGTTIPGAAAPNVLSDSPLSQAVRYSPEADTLRSPRQVYADATLLSQYLFNGPRYHVYDPREETHQFYKTRNLLQGTLRYDGRDYGPFQMHYDLNFGFLVVKQPVNGYLVRLDSTKIEHFTLDGDLFERIVDNPQLKPGIYQHLYNGETRLICQRKKQRMEKIEDMKVIAIYIDADTYYVYKDGAFRQVQRKKDLFTLFPDRKSEIRGLLRRSLLPFRQNKEDLLLEIAKLLDQPKTSR